MSARDPSDFTFRRLELFIGCLRSLSSEFFPRSSLADDFAVVKNTLKRRRVRIWSAMLALKQVVLPKPFMSRADLMTGNEFRTLKFNGENYTGHES